MKKIKLQNSVQNSIQNPQNPLNSLCELSKNDQEICQIMTNILNISEEEVSKNLHLFSNINPYIQNSLYYLAKMHRKDMLINATCSLEFVWRFDKKISD